jgi:hypothetical protein
LDGSPAGGRQIVAAPGLLLKDWGEDTAVVYAPSAAQTHWISAEAAGLLRALSDGAAPGALLDDADPTLLDGLLRVGLLQRTR